jgi:hypothetical protein
MAMCIAQLSRRKEHISIRRSIIASNRAVTVRAGVGMSREPDPKKQGPLNRRCRVIL